MEPMNYDTTEKQLLDQHHRSTTGQEHKSSHTFLQFERWHNPRN